MTLADAITAHDEALTYGGLEGIINLGSIESAIARPYSGYFRPIYKKAAVVVRGVINNHGFTDGNKRTALLLAEIMIDRSGYRLDIDDDEPVDDLALAVAEKQIELEDLFAWFKLRIVKQ